MKVNLGQVLKTFWNTIGKQSTAKLLEKKVTSYLHTICRKYNMKEEHESEIVKNVSELVLYVSNAKLNKQSLDKQLILEQIKGPIAQSLLAGASSVNNSDNFLSELLTKVDETDVNNVQAFFSGIGMSDTSLYIGTFKEVLERIKEGTAIDTIDTSSYKQIEEDIPYEGEYLLSLMLDKSVHNCVVWLLLINHEYLRKIELNFYPGIIHEDELFTTILTLQSHSIYCLKQSFIKHRIRSASTMGLRYTKRNMNCYLTVIDELFNFQNSPIIRKFAKYTLSKVFYTGHQIPFTEKPCVFWRAAKSGYLKYIGWKSSLVFWLK